MPTMRTRSEIHAWLQRDPPLRRRASDLFMVVAQDCRSEPELLGGVTRRMPLYYAGPRPGIRGLTERVLWHPDPLRALALSWERAMAVATSAAAAQSLAEEAAAQSVAVQSLAVQGSGLLNAWWRIDCVLIAFAKSITGSVLPRKRQHARKPGKFAR